MKENMENDIIEESNKRRIKTINTYIFLGCYILLAFCIYGGG